MPLSISPQAQAALVAAQRSAKPPYPAAGDTPAWRGFIADMDARMRQIAVTAGDLPGVTVEERQVAGVKVHDVMPAAAKGARTPLLLDFHGGALIAGSGAFARLSAIGLALKLGVRVWAVDYRLPPDHPYPAGLDDGVAVYRAALKLAKPSEIGISGASAGGNLAAATVLRARDAGLPLPAGVVLLTPELDLTESGDTFQTNAGIDVVLQEPLMPANLFYAAGADLADPYVSPLFGDFSKGFPPTFLASGTRDLFLSNTVRMHAALLDADAVADIYIVEAGPHGGFGNAPEGVRMYRQLARFVRDRMGWRGDAA